MSTRPEQSQGSARAGGAASKLTDGGHRGQQRGPAIRGMENEIFSAMI
jgi:hypothetical protein